MILSLSARSCENSIFQTGYFFYSVYYLQGPYTFLRISCHSFIDVFHKLFKEFLGIDNIASDGAMTDE